MHGYNRQLPESPPPNRLATSLNFCPSSTSSALYALSPLFLSEQKSFHVPLRLISPYSAPNFIFKPLIIDSYEKGSNIAIKLTKQSLSLCDNGSSGADRQNTPKGCLSVTSGLSLDNNNKVVSCSDSAAECPLVGPSQATTPNLSTPSQALSLSTSDKISPFMRQSGNLNHLLLMPIGSFVTEANIATVTTSNGAGAHHDILDVSTSNETKKWLVNYMNQNPMLKSFLAGSMSGTCSTLLFQPFDLLKTRLQNAHFSMNSIGTSSASSTRMVPIIFDVVKNEQLLGLWRGTTPSLVRCVPGVGLHFCCLDTLQNHFCPGRQPSAVEALTFGMASRSLAGILLIPVTVVKTRYESGVFLYKNMTDAIRHTYAHEGVRGLTSGLLPTLMRDVPFSGLYYMFYSQFKKVVLPLGQQKQQKNSKKLQTILSNNMMSSSFLTFLCGLNAGLMASVVTQPMDVVKTHMQLYPKQFPSFLPTVIFIVKQKGMQGLFAGLVPRMARRTMVASMTWTVFEQMMQSFGLK